MATIQYTAKVRGSRILELPESASELELKPGEDICISVDRVRNTDATGANSDILASAPGVLDYFDDELRDKYRDLVLKKVRHQLTADDEAQLEAVRHQLNELDKQSGALSNMEKHISRVERQLSDISRELDSYPDSLPTKK